MRVLCVLFPHFPLRCEAQRVHAFEARSTLVVYEAGSQKLVLDYPPELDGLQAGAPLQQALARHDEVKLLQADIPYYWAVFNGILDGLETRSPLVEDAGLGTAYLGLDGMQLIYPDDKAVFAAVKEAIPEAFAPQIGIAGGKFPAYLAALHSPAGGCRVLEGDTGAFLRDLPCDILPVSPRSKDKLRNFGIKTLGQLAALPPGPLQAQFGPEGKKILELAGGIDRTPLCPRGLAETIEENTTLSSVTVSLEAILVAVETLLARAFAREALRGKGVRSLTLWTRTWDAAHWERKIPFKEPASDMKGITSRIKQVLESFPQPGPVEQVGLRLTRLGYITGRQKSIFTQVMAKDSLLEDIKQLELRLDSAQVFKVKEVEPWSRIPERRFVLSPLNQ
ncbi:MAG: hypothetical protein HYX96_05965 [Chloroflexi bacterium]|nr:hypothetical protein [Chloroflexota bacterium]